MKIPEDGGKNNHINSMQLKIEAVEKVLFFPGVYQTTTFNWFTYAFVFTCAHDSLEIPLNICLWIKLNETEWVQG